MKQLLLTLILLLTAAGAWADFDTRDITYIDANGDEQTAENVNLITSDEQLTNLTPGWYAYDVDKNFSNEKCKLSTVDKEEQEGDIHLIILDGRELKLSENGEYAPISISCGSLYVYAQSRGDDAGKITATVTDSNEAILVTGDIVINGCVISAECNSKTGISICTEKGSITINGGTVTATANGNSSIGINAYTNTVTINGGTVTATGGSRGISTTGVYFNGGSLTATATNSSFGVGIDSDVYLKWSSLDDRFKASGLYQYGDKYNSLIIAEGYQAKDVDGNTYSGTITAADFPNGVELMPLNFSPKEDLFTVDVDGTVTGFDNLDDAAAFANAADAPATLTLLQDVADISAKIELGSPAGVTLDLNGHSVSGDVENEWNIDDYSLVSGGIFYVGSGNKLTVIDSGDGGTISNNNSWGGSGILNFGTLTFSGGAITSDNNSATGISNYGMLTFSGGTITAEGEGCCGMWNYGTLIVSSGTITAKGKKCYGLYNCIDFSNPTVTPELTVSGGTITAEGEKCYGIYNEGSLTVSGGTITALGGGAFGIDNRDKTVLTVKPGATVIGGIKASGTVTYEGVIARVTKAVTIDGNDADETVYFASLFDADDDTAVTAAAFANAAAAPATLTLLQDVAGISACIELGSPAGVTLDLNGRSVSGYVENGGSSDYFLEGGIFYVGSGNKLTVIDSSGGGTISNSRTRGCSGIINHGTLTVSGGTIASDGESASGIWSYGIVVVSGGTITAKGGGCYGLYNCIASNNPTATPEITVSGGTITAKGEGCYGIYNEGSLTVSYGTITAKGGGSFGISNICNTYDTVTPELTVSGGTITALGEECYGIYNEGSLTVSGGEITAEGEGAVCIDNRATLTLNVWPTFSGESRVSDIKLGDGMVITFGEDLSGAPAEPLKVGLGENALPYTFTSGFGTHVTMTGDNDTPLDISDFFEVTDVEGDLICDDNGEAQLLVVEMVAYIDADGNLHDDLDQSTEDTADDGLRAIVLNGGESQLGTDGEETWYVAMGSIAFADELTIAGDVNIVLADDCNLAFNDNTYGDGNNSLTFFAQSTGESKGRFTFNEKFWDNYDSYEFEIGALTVNGGDMAFYNPEGLNFSGDVTINGGNVLFIASFDVDNAFVFNGGNLNVQGLVSAKTVTLGWTNADDEIYVGEIKADAITVAEGKRFFIVDNEDSATGILYEGEVAAETIKQKALKPLDGALITAPNNVVVTLPKNNSAAVAEVSLDDIHYYIYKGEGGTVNLEYTDGLPDGMKSVAWSVTGVSLDPYDYFDEANYRNDVNEYASFAIPATNGPADYSITTGGNPFLMPGGFCGVDDPETVEDESKSLWWTVDNDGSGVRTLTLFSADDGEHDIAGDADYAWDIYEPLVAVIANTTAVPSLGSQFASVNAILIDGNEDFLLDYKAKLKENDTDAEVLNKLAPMYINLSNLSQSGWLTFCYNYPVSYDFKGLATVWQVTGIDGSSNSVEIAESELVAPDTPYLVEYDKSISELTMFAVPETAVASIADSPVSEATDGNSWWFFGNNSSQAFDSDDILPIGNGGTVQSYVLRGGVFVAVDSNEGIAAHKCWLNVDSGSANGARRLTIGTGNDSGTTAIGDAKRNGDSNSKRYNIGGQRVGRDYRGFVIENGKKVIIK